VKYDKEFAIDPSRCPGNEPRESERKYYGVEVNPSDYQRKPSVERITAPVVVRPVLKRKRPGR